MRKPVEETNRATYEKLFHLLLIVFGVVIGWILCYYFPLIGHKATFAIKVP